MRRKTATERSHDETMLLDQLEKWTALRDGPEWANFRKQLSGLMAKMALTVVDLLNANKVDEAKREAAVYDSYTRLLGLAHRRAHRLEDTLGAIHDRYHLNGEE